MSRAVPCAVIGAGIAGLSLARALTSRGVATVVLERARGVGGRCATRRIDGRPVDHGVAYLHGHSERFRAEIASLGAGEIVPGWPRTRVGTGVPCQPEAFDTDGFRLALHSGVSLFAKRLAQGLDVRLQTEVVALHADDGWRIRLSSGETLQAETLALTMPAPSAVALLRATPSLPAAFSAIIPTMALIHTLPCLTVIARYPESVAPPSWETSFPSAGNVVHAILQDGSKRVPQLPVTLVIQARSRFSRDYLSRPPEQWSPFLLQDAAALHGSWIAKPELVQAHAWHHARVDAPSRLTAPILVRAAGGPGLGLAGDGFHTAGGVEGAFLSGLALADRIAEVLVAQ